MNHVSKTLPTRCGTLLVCILLATSANAELLPPGFRARPLGVHALVGGKVVPKPGETLDGATVVIRNGLIEAVGRDVTAPPDARVWDVKGLTIYAGFIEPYLAYGSTNAPVSTGDTEPINADSLTAGGISFFGVTGQRTDPGSRGPGAEPGKVTPEFRAVRGYSPEGRTLTPLRELGFTTAVIAPIRGVVRGTSALVSLAEADPNEIVVRADVFQHIAFETGAGDEPSYPTSLMGAIAAVRQSFFNAQHYALDQADWQRNPVGRLRPEFNPSCEALLPAAEAKQRVLIEPGSVLMVDRAARFARELKLDFALVSSGQEWRRPELANATGATFIVPVNFPTLPKLPSDEDWGEVSLDQLRVWDWAAENPALLRQQGREIALTTYSLSDKKTFRKNLKLALERGLSETDALAALTTVPARLCGVEKQLGTIEPGKIANLTIVDGKGYFDPEARVREVWIDGRNLHLADAKEAKKDEAADSEKAAKTKADKAKKEAESRELRVKRIARSPLEGRGAITNPPVVLVRNATFWTSSDRGVLTNVQLLIQNGKIQQLGEFKVELGPNTLVIDAQGGSVTPGLIDAHSHTAILGAVNESTLPSTAMVRIGRGKFRDEEPSGATRRRFDHG